MKDTLTLFLFVLIGTGSAIFSQTVTIGTQVWMTKNLDVSTFRNGDPIPEVKTQEEWEEAGKNKQPAWCYYDNDPKNGEKYGKLYNWYAVNDPRGLAPTGWHVPTDAEWRTLTVYLGSYEGTKLKSEPEYEKKIRYVEEGGYYETKWVPCNNCSYWTEKQKANNPCTVCRNERGKKINTGKYIPKTKRKIEEKYNIGWDGTNESGFSGLPGGTRDYYGFKEIGAKGDWWCSTEFGTPFARSYTLGSSSSFILRYYDHMSYGFSVRCLKD